MSAVRFLHDSMTDDELISHCFDLNRQMIGGDIHGNMVVKLSDQTVIKFGVGVTEEEANNMRRASKLIDPNIVRVPSIHRYFTDKRGWGYIVMEYMEGRIVEPLEDPALIRRVAEILDHFATLYGDRPGPLGGGVPRGLLFSDLDFAFNSTLCLEKWLNGALFEHNPKVSLQGDRLVLCHLDVAPRNIIWLKDGSISFVDWSSAGFYPRSFEECLQWINFDKDGKFNQLLLGSMRALSVDEAAQVTPILLSYRNSQVYHLSKRRSFI